MQLTWLDESRTPVQSGGPSDPSESSNETEAQSYTQMFVRMNDTSGAGVGLEETRLVWNFRAHREQHNKLYTCQAKHKAFELPVSNELGALGVGEQPVRRLERTIRLSVLYEPEVELSREPLQPREFMPIRFHCQAQARPNKIQFSWFIDDQLVPNATESELFVSSLTRQLHLREIRCQATNAIGTTSSNATRLAVRYSPAYATHQLPASLQPDHHAWRLLNDNGDEGEPARVEQNLVAAGVKGAETPSGGNFTHLFRRLDRRIAAEMAVGAAPNSDATLRCDFDANPAPAQVVWFKVNTEYSNMRDVTPHEADELIAFGANRAVFKLAPQGELEEEEQDDDDELARAASGQHKRHISIEQAAQAGALEEEEDEAEMEPNWDRRRTTGNKSAGRRRQGGRLARLHELDFEQMANELELEMKFLQAQQQQLQERLTNQSAAASWGEKLVEAVPSSQVLPPSQTIVAIEEPLEFRLVPRRARRRRPTLARQNGTTVVAARAKQQEEPVGTTSETSATEVTREERLKPAHELLLMRTAASGIVRRQPLGAAAWTGSLQGHASNRPEALQARQAQLTSSMLRLRQVNSDATGRYVCKALAAPNFNSTAKSVFFVLQQQPRIISVAQQWAPLGAQQVQVECLVQINTVLDNQTQVSWLRDGKVSILGPFSLIDDLLPVALCNLEAN